jgi:ATP-dependent helicase/DNAse subunit B
MNTASLREALLAPWWPIGLPERAEFLTRTRDHDLLSELRLHFPKVGEVITELQARALHEAPLQIFSRLLADSGARGFMLSHAEHVDGDLSLVRKLFGYLEDISVRDPGQTFAQAVDALSKAHEHGLEWVKSSALTREGHVSVITAHKVKGMEFERVFVVGLTENEWERGGMGAKIPSPIDMRRTADDAIKQFYVAITRAKDALTFSYSMETLEGRERKPSMLIPNDLSLLTPSVDPLPLLHHEVDAPKLVQELTRTYLFGDGLSPSALQEYLDSPPTFFARRVLKLREPEATSMVIGTAVHAGIAEYLKSEDAEKAQTELERALTKSLLPRTSAYDQACKDARARLTAFIKERSTLGTVVAVEKAYRAKRMIAGETVNLFGKLDAVLENEGKRAIVDFKTSTTVRGKEESYVLQLAFYDYLLREEGEPATGACIVQVRTDGIESFPIPLSEETQSTFQGTLDEVLPEMLSGRWRQGASREGSEYDDLLELFRD